MIDKKKYFEDSVNSSRLVVHSDNSTSLLETMAANFPSLIFWNPKFYELTEEAKPFFDKFYDLGIMHYDSKSVAKKINEIYSDINQWWQDEEIQNVRNSFSKKFCLSSSNYLLEWKNFFTKSSV